MTEPRPPLAELQPFDFAPRTRVVFGPGTLSRLGALAGEIGGRRALLVTDAGLKQAGHQERAVASLKAAGIDVEIFDDVHPNPTTEDVERGVEFARDRKIDLLIGLGGGSSMDAAKGMNFLLTNGGKMQDYKGTGKAQKPMLPLIAVPTTSGTGSEAQSYAVIADAKTHMKMACGDHKAAARIAILDPELTVTMPASVTAATGIDAISHALESYVTTVRTPVSTFFARRAWNLLYPALPVVLEEPGHLQARGAMLLGAHFAGMAIENSMLGATHALVNPVSAHFGTVHGVGIGVLLPHVIRFNSEVVCRNYGDLVQDVGLCRREDPAAGPRLAEAVERVVALAGNPASLRNCDVRRDLLPQMADEAAEQWTGRFNPRPVDRTSLLALYEGSY
jgi:alcohol dehydrogenase